MCCTDTRFNELITEYKWDIIEEIYRKDPDQIKNIPANEYTYNAYRYIIDLTRTGDKRVKLSNSLVQVLLKECASNTYLVTNFCLTDDILANRWEEFDVKYLLQYQQLPFDVIRQMTETICRNSAYWELLCRYQSVPLSFIEEYNKYIHWYAFSQNKTLTNDVIRKYKDKLFWPEITKLGLVEELIYEFEPYMDDISWRNVSCFSVLSDEIINKFADKLDVPSLLVFQNLKDETIEMLIAMDTKNEKEWLWNKASDYQCLSYDFIMRNKKHIALQKLISNKKISRRDIFRAFDCTLSRF
jgi:hypothetical protein